MRYQCPFCSFANTVEARQLGYRITCVHCGKSVMVPQGEFDEGRVIGDFVIRTKLGAGAIGAVYKAYQISLERIVALKVLSKQYMTNKGVSEFLREARAASKLTHNNLVQSYAFGEDDGVYYMAMTYINGETLKTRIKREHSIPCDEALHIIQQVAEALHYAWTESRLVHRDVKPDNIMIAEHGVVKLTDLGLAIKPTEWREDMDVSGSPSYMSPEQFAGEKLDPRSDIYSLGVTLYQMLTGDLPFDATTVGSIARQHFEMKPPDLSKKVPGIPPRVCDLVYRMMAKLPKNRFRDMEALLKEIWSIRQTTAPDQDLVPDVHTISMKRLDYDMQTLAANEQKKITAQTSEKPQKNFSNAALIGWIVVLFLLVLAAFFALIQLKNDNRKGKIEAYFHALENDVSDFESMTSDNSVSAGEAALEADRILKKMEQHDSAESVRERALQAYVLQLLKSITPENKIADPELSAKIVSLERELSGLRQGHVQLTMELDETRRKLDEASAILSERDSLELDLIECRTQLDVQKKLFETQSAELQKRADALLTFTKTRFAGRILECWSKQRFVEAAQVINQAKLQYADLTGWFEEIMPLNVLCRRLYDELNQSQSTYAKRTFTNARAVQYIRNGIIGYCFPDTSLVQEISWDKLIPADAWMIVSGNAEMFPDEKMTCAAFELISDRFGAACRENPKSEIVCSLVDLYAAYSAERILAMEPQNRKSAESLYTDFKRRFSGAPSYETLMAKLLPVFEQPKENK